MSQRALVGVVPSILCCAFFINRTAKREVDTAPLIVESLCMIIFLVQYLAKWITTKNRYAAVAGATQSPRWRVCVEAVACQFRRLAPLAL